jgi:uncharacterized protein YaaQ
MKLILAIIPDSDNEEVSQSLVNRGFRVTRIASTGGFLRRGSTTLMIGTEDDQVDHAFETIRLSLGPASESGASRANLFVLNVDQFQQV